jgi:hypothetical protein
VSKASAASPAPRLATGAARLLRAAAASLAAVFCCVPALCLAEAATVVRATELRRAPATDAESAGALAENARVEALERQGGWTRVRAAGGAEGWVRMLALRYEGTGAARQGDSGITQAINVARTGTSGTQVTTGVRGLDADQVANAKPNTAELKKLERYTASRDAAATFAERGQLRARQVDYP